MKPSLRSTGSSAPIPAWLRGGGMTRFAGIVVLLLLPLALMAQGGGSRAEADALFAKQKFAEALPLYTQLVSLAPGDHDLNYRLGTCIVHGRGDKEKAVGFLKYAVTSPTVPALAWYYYGRAYHLTYQFAAALDAYERYRGTADKKTLAVYPVDALELQCRNGKELLNNIKDIEVLNKVEVNEDEFFRFYDLRSIGGKIVVTPEELKSGLDKKSGVVSLVYLPDKGGPIYFASYGKNGDAGRDIYRTELMPNGTFATPVKLAGYINTAQDEDFPFMAPDGKHFYFCSKGHNSMGGFDVFRSSYDKGLDVFGAPENMDFAVNTPDDELLYLTDPEGKEACFASGRDSRQGSLQVYRVNTATAPVNLTVLKGTFASQFDPKDRKAHISVVDALTQQPVTEVRTDMNGNYVIALPRSGKYRFLVEAGPGGKTHAGLVELPRSDGPRAYRQELSLENQGGEKLVIRNYFDQPLDEDMIALALDEIKRRAKLDVSGPVVVQEEPLVEKSPTDDPLTRAGFSGDVSKADALRMAGEEAAALAQDAASMDQRSAAAYRIAKENATVADALIAQAEDLVTKANAATDDGQKNALMARAGRQRANARAAYERARAALRTGETLAAEARGSRDRASVADGLQKSLQVALAGTNEDVMVAELTKLRAQLDQKNAPDARLTPAEKLRRQATQREKESAALTARAHDARNEENELIDRIGRIRLEESAARGGKKDELARNRLELEAQLEALHQENERAVAKAGTAEQESASARGQAALASKLETGNTVADPFPEAERSQLAQQIASTGPRIGAIALDERFDGTSGIAASELERRTFDWGVPVTLDDDGGGGDILALDGGINRTGGDQGTTTADKTTSGSKDTNTSNTPTGTNTGQASTGEQPNGQITAAAQQASGDQGTTTADKTTSGSTGTNTSDTSAGTTTGQAPSGEQPNGQTTAASQQAGGDQGTTTAIRATSGSTGTNASNTPTGTNTGQASTGEQPNGQTTAAAQQAGGDQGTTTADKAASGSTGTNASDTSAGATTGQASTGEQPNGQTTAAAQQAGGDQGTTTADKAASGSTGTNASDTSAGTTTGQASTGEQPNGQATAQGADGRQGTATRDASTTGNPEVASASVRAAGDTAMAPEARAGNNNIRVSDAGGRAAVDGAAGTSGVSNGRDPLVQGSPSTDSGAPQATREGSHAISRAPDDVATTRGAPAGGVPDASPNGTATGAGNGREEGALIDGTASAPNTPTPEEIAFVQANELAELKQMRGAERDRQRRDSLDTRISELEQAMRAGSRTDEAGELVEQQSGQQGSTGTGTGSTTGAEPTAPVSSDISSGAPERATIAQRPALIFDPGMSEGELVARIHPDYTADRERLQRDVDDPEERSAALHGLELMLVDSIGAETDRQLSRLERDTTDKAQVLARVDRLRRLKEDHLREADEVLASAGQRYEASESRTVEDLILLNDQPTEGSADVDRAMASPTPHNDDYVRIRTEPDMVYSSTMDHRSTEKGFSTAIRDRDRDMEVLTGLEEKIDSLETVLESMPVGRDFTKLRDRTDKLIDQHMVLRMEMGQRMEFITRSEYKAAKDSLTLLAAQNNVKGLAPSEPMAQLATSYEQEARRVMDEAAVKRKQADRIELVVVRDSLFRTAYVEELSALRLMDRAQTIRSYMQRRDFQRGERISYEEVEARMFGPVIEAPAAVAQVRNEPDTSTTGRAVVPGTEPAIVEGSVEVAVNKVSVDADPANAEARAARLKAGELETASLIAADRVNTLRDSIPKARRSDRDELEREVLRQTALSDSLHRASLAAGEEAARLEQETAAAREAKAFQDRLMRYYYLDDQEMALVLNEEDRSRYFQARAKALAQQDEAARAHEQAAASKALADTIQAQSRAMLTVKDTGAAAVDAEVMRRAALLSDQAVRLNLRSDSLERVARRMELAASANAAQAATILQGLSPERGTVIMAMEQRTRRVEPVLAEARSLQAAESVRDTSGGTRDGLAQAPVRSGSRTSATDAVPVSTTEEQVAQNAGQGNVPAPSTGGIATTPTSMSTSQPSTGSADVAITPAAPALLPVLASDVFSMDVIQPRSGAIPIDAPMPSGVVYKVQIGAFRQDIPAQLFSDMTPVTGESVANGLTRYTAGMFTTPEGAVKAAETVRQRGYRDAFVVAYQDGRRVSLGQAMRAGRPTTAQVTGTISANTTASRPGTTVRIEATGTSGIVGAQGGTVAMTDSARAAEQAVLANYPASADEVLAQFAPTADATAYYNVPGAAPARQVETVKGLFFTVQVGVYSKPTALDKLFNITPLNSERTENAKIRYTTGVYVDMDKARSRKDEAVGLGVKDAFITAYLNGKRIPMRDARALINKFGTAVFADPGVITR